ncbi:uncharacterized protein [Aegilops tauschii subsp. strangulata]|uniref:Heat stress transcription factor A-2e n=1 Tax=Aegilops tauschii TaxID=37682 RepID=R7W5A4_AEGTA|nr:uncharacterized protein LOC123172373 [Triticum aestivum]
MSHRMMSPVKVEGRPCPSPAAGGGGAPRPMDGLGDTGPTPFLAKTYDMVDDPAMDAVISWSATNRSSSGPPPLRHRAIAEVLQAQQLLELRPPAQHLYSRRRLSAVVQKVWHGNSDILIDQASYGVIDSSSALGANSWG